MSLLLLICCLVSQVEKVGGHLVTGVQLIVAACVTDWRASAHVYLPAHVQIVGGGLSLHGDLRVLLNHEQVGRVRTVPSILIHALGLEEGLILLHLLLHKVLHDACVVLQAVIPLRLVQFLWVDWESLRLKGASTVISR